MSRISQETAYNLRIEIDRCEALLKMYEEIPEGRIGAAMIRATLSLAETALKLDDHEKAVHSLEELNKIEG